MAFIKLAVTTTLPVMQANVRKKTGTLSEEESELLKPELDNICHNAIVAVRTRYGKSLNGLYKTSETVTEASNLIVISTKDIFDIFDMELYDGTHGQVPLLRTVQFNNLRTLYAGETDALFAHISNIVATDNKLQIQTLRGSAVTTPGTLTLSYPRNPVKTVNSDTDKKLDLPEHLIPEAEDMAARAVLQLLKEKFQRN